ncbi:hypothetical protein AC578_9523 [Pseudocercospora eumusae]|uniref:Rhodopsin domain-containing protein n=1 Tax=Pseudocercospora eumusae TaxID=321146 RepID=A0A139HG93_9PEZI|nr:hypothetical protein AC578_9523 [Pseudocercospora eumusae]
MFREDIDDSLVNTSIPLQAQPVSPVAAHFGAGDLGIEALGPTIAFTTLATLIVALRWYTRACLVRRVGKDDYVILISLVLSWTMCIIIGVSIGEGSPSILSGLSSTCAYSTALGLEGAAISYSSYFCLPLLGASLEASSYASLPQRSGTLGYQGLAGMLRLIGLCIVGVARMATVLASAEQGDYILSGVWAIIWSSVEGNISIICASLLSLKALVTRVFPRLLEQTAPARHAMRLPHVSGAGSEWEQGDSQATTLGNSGSSLLHPSKLKGIQGDGQAAMCRVPPACMPPTSTPRRSRHKPADSRTIDPFRIQADAQHQDDDRSEASSS